MVFTALINGYSTWYCCCLEAYQVIHPPCHASKPTVFLTIAPSRAVLSSGSLWYSRPCSFPFSLWRHGNSSYPFFPRRSMLTMPLFKQSQDSIGLLSCFHLPTHQLPLFAAIHWMTGSIDLTTAFTRLILLFPCVFGKAEGLEKSRHQPEPWLEVSDSVFLTTPLSQRGTFKQTTSFDEFRQSILPWSTPNKMIS